MKKKLLTILTLLLCVCSGAWADFYPDVNYYNLGTDAKSGITITKSDKWTTQAPSSNTYFSQLKYSQALKMEGATDITFTTTQSMTLTIAQSTADNPDATIKLDGTVLSVDNAAIHTIGSTSYAGHQNIKWYCLILAAGTHHITQGTGQAFLVYLGLTPTSAFPDANYITMNGTVRQSGSIKFTPNLTTPKYALNSSAACSFYGNTFSYSLKQEGVTYTKFTTDQPTILTVVQNLSANSDKTIGLTGTTHYTTKTALGDVTNVQTTEYTTEQTVGGKKYNKVRIFKIFNLPADEEYSITQGDGQSYVAYIGITDVTGPMIMTQPLSAEYNVGDDATDLSVTALASTGELSYQWKSCTAADKTGSTNIVGATSATLSASNFPTTSDATFYFYCTVTDGQSSTDTEVVTITVETAKNASDIAVSTGKGTINTTVGADNYTLTQGTDFTTSSDGTLSYTSSIPGVAYVNASTGELEFVGAGTTTITLTQAESSSYYGGNVSFTVNVLPAECLNLGNTSDAITQLKKGWSYDSPYFDTENKLVIISSYAAYSTANQEYQKWIATSKNTDGKSDPATFVVGGASNKASWSTSSPFIGGTGYYRDDTNPRYATTNSSRPWTVYKFRVKGITAAQAYVKGNNASRYVTIAAYEITDGALASAAAKSANTSNGNEAIISVTDLDSNKEYLITVGNTVYSSNLNFYEIAFTASASDIEIPSNRITTSAAGWASYTPMYNVSSTIYKPGSSSAASDIKIYAISAVTDGDATLAEVTSGTEKGMKANNGFFLRGAANTTYRTTATSGSVEAPASNLIKGQTTTGTVKSDESNTRYALLTYDAEKYGLYKLNTTGVTMPAGKAYLEVAVPLSRSANFLAFNYDNETTEINTITPVVSKNIGVRKYVENGKLIIEKDGIKYNVAGSTIK